jgi:hypothetical protein
MRPQPMYGAMPANRTRRRAVRFRAAIAYDRARAWSPQTQEASVPNLLLLVGCLLAAMLLRLQLRLGPWPFAHALGR